MEYKPMHFERAPLDPFTLPMFNSKLPQKSPSHKAGGPLSATNSRSLAVPRHRSEKQTALTVDLKRTRNDRSPYDPGPSSLTHFASNSKQREERIQIDGYRRCFANALGLKNASYAIARTTTQFEIEPGLVTRNDTIMGNMNRQ